MGRHVDYKRHLMRSALDRGLKTGEFLQYKYRYKLRHESHAAKEQRRKVHLDTNGGGGGGSCSALQDAAAAVQLSLLGPEQVFSVKGKELRDLCRLMGVKKVRVAWVRGWVGEWADG